MSRDEVVLRVRKKHVLVLLLVAALFAVVTAHAELPHTFESGRTISAGEVMENFQYLEARVDEVDARYGSPVVAFFSGADSAGTGILEDRKLERFEKQRDDTALRIVYSDYFHAGLPAGGQRGGNCMWEVLVNGLSCQNPHDHEPSALIVEVGVKQGPATSSRPRPHRRHPGRYR